MLLKGPGATGSPIPACSGRVHPNSLFQQSYAFTFDFYLQKLVAG
jgi:hypothetical protein